MLQHSSDTNCKCRGKAVLETGISIRHGIQSLILWACHQQHSKVILSGNQNNIAVYIILTTRSWHLYYCDGTENQCATQVMRKREAVPGRESRPECGPQGLWKADRVDHGFIALGVASDLLVVIFPTVDHHYLFYFYPYSHCWVIHQSFTQLLKCLWSTYCVLDTMLIILNAGDTMVIKAESLPL